MSRSCSSRACCLWPHAHAMPNPFTCFHVVLLSYYIFLLYNYSAKPCLLRLDMNRLKIYYGGPTSHQTSPTKYCNCSCLHVFNAIDFHNAFFQFVFNDFPLPCFLKHFFSKRDSKLDLCLICPRNMIFIRLTCSPG